MEPNNLAPISIAVFPLFVWALFLRYRPPVAVAVSLLVAELVLPPNYVLPISPTWLGKWTVPQFAIGVAMLFAGRSYIRKSLRWTRAGLGESRKGFASMVRKRPQGTER